MATYFDPEEIVEFKNVFYELDIQRNGTIKTSDLESALNSLGFNPTQKVLERLTLQGDPHNEGYIFFEDYLDIIVQMNKLHQRNEELCEVFRDNDKDCDGLVIKDELILILKRLGLTVSEDKINEMVTEADKDGDGRINLEEFLDVMNSINF